MSDGVHQLRREQVVRAGLDEVFEFFAQARNLEVLTPPWLSFEVLTPEPVAMQEGTLLDYRLRLHGLPLRWRSRIEAWEPGRVFVDRQIRGPYRLWHHRHEFEVTGEGTVVRDIVHYALPLGPLGEIAHAVLVRRDLARIFDFRRDAAVRVLGAP
jgi:ligand-binding SRPBCC domain-containing protein